MLINAQSDNDEIKPLAQNTSTLPAPQDGTLDLFTKKGKVNKHTTTPSTKANDVTAHLL